MDRLDLVLFVSLFIFVLYFSLGFSPIMFFLTIVLFIFCLLTRKIFLAIFLFGLVFSRLFIWDQYQFVDLGVVDEETEAEFYSVSVCAEPDRRLNFVNYTVCDIDKGLLDSRFLLKYKLYPRFEYGDQLEFEAVMKEPFESDEFSYADYLKIFRIQYLLEVRGEIEVVESNPNFFTHLYRLKDSLVLKLEKVLPEPYASLGNGLLFGIRKGFTDEYSDILQVTGLTHIVAVSGYNVSLVILLVDRLLFFVPRRARYYVMVAFIVVFAFLAGLSASVVRACFMGWIAVTVLQYGYSESIVRSLLLTAFCMVVYNPAILFFDVGFQLSFYATLGVVFISKFFSFNWLTSKLGIRESLILTISAQITTMPTMIYYFGNLSLISPLANVLVAPFLPLLMLLSFLMIIFSESVLISSFLRLIGVSVNFVFFEIVKFCSLVKVAYIEFPVKNLWILLLIYFGIFVFILYRYKSADLQK